MTNPFRIDGPAVVSFSGGSTSALMLHRILQAWGGQLPPDLHVLFANTGKERPETLDFVQECATRWSVAVRWLELRVDAEGSFTFAEVDYSTASRDGEPFTALIQALSYLPNPVARVCTQEMKVRTFKRWMKAQGHEHWTNVVGLRADEPGRVARMRAGEGKELWDVAMPLADAGVTKADVRAFWGGQPFRLNLREWEGNCDLCFLKGRAKRERIMRDFPHLAKWWAEAEAEAKVRVKGTGTGATFRSDVPSYAALLAKVQAQPMLDFGGACNLDTEDDLADCICGSAA